MPQALYAAVKFLLEQTRKTSEPAIAGAAQTHSAAIGEEYDSFAHGVVGVSHADAEDTRIAELRAELQTAPLDAVSKSSIPAPAGLAIPLAPQAPVAE